MEENKVNAIDALFDETNTDNIVLYNENDEAVEFEQIAITPSKETGAIYAILKPVQEIEGVNDDEAFVFEVMEDEEGGLIKLVQDEKIINEVFAEYNELVKNSK